MPSLTKILERIPELNKGDRDWLHRLIGDWQIIADLTFSDLILTVRSGGKLMVAAQVRPATAATMFEYDIVGLGARLDMVPYFEAALETNRVQEMVGASMRHLFVPISRTPGNPIAVMAIASNQRPDRMPSQAQLSYEDVADELIEMVRAGDFPVDGSPTGYRHGTPRVSDGFAHVDSTGEVLYISPNAVSNFRRLGVDEALTGNNLAELVSAHLDSHEVDESLPVVLLGRAAWIAEVESRGIAVSMRAVPLKRDGRPTGAVILTRDVTELRRQERQLMTKDATIREINHRVKNNLQTVSALLRLQARRATNEETKAALSNAQRRVSTIALVHERLSETIDEVVEFDALFIPLIRLIRDASITVTPVRTTFEGSFGRVRAEQATALAIVLNEILTNAIEHGITPDQSEGIVGIEAQRFGSDLVVYVRDNGTGIEGEGPGSGLGTQIVHTMVSGELSGTIQWRARDGGGTEVELRASLKS